MRKIRQSSATPSHSTMRYPCFQTSANEPLVEAFDIPVEMCQKCTHCSQRFSSKHDLKTHMSSQHGQLMPFTCSLCGKGYQTSMGLIYHRRAHEGRVYPCPICDSKLTRRNSMKSHLRSKHFVAECDACSGIFKLGPDYNEHVQHCVR